MGRGRDREGERGMGGVVSTLNNIWASPVRHGSSDVFQRSALGHLMFSAMGHLMFSFSGTLLQPPWAMRENHFFRGGGITALGEEGGSLLPYEFKRNLMKWFW